MIITHHFLIFGSQGRRKLSARRSATSRLTQNKDHMVANQIISVVATWTRTPVQRFGCSAVNTSYTAHTNTSKIRFKKANNSWPHFHICQRPGKDNQKAQCRYFFTMSSASRSYCCALTKRIFHILNSIRTAPSI